MVAADMFSAFHEAGLDDRTAVRKTGERFRDTVLLHGGSCHPGETFRMFRGRDPSPSALLAHFALRKPLGQ
jgi:oligopeptidase A